MFSAHDNNDENDDNSLERQAETAPFSKMNVSDRTPERRCPTILHGQ